LFCSYSYNDTRKVKRDQVAKLIPIVKKVFFNDNIHPIYARKHFINLGIINFPVIRLYFNKKLRSIIIITKRRNGEK